MPMRLGSTFVNREAPNLPSHLWVVISEPDASRRVAIVDLTSCQGDGDDCSCLFDRGDHTFVHHQTYVDYADAKIVSLATLSGLLTKNLIDPHADASDDFLDRIWQGATRSTFTKNEVLNLLRSQNLI